MYRFEALGILGLSESFSDSELKAAFAKKAKEHHPEVDPEGFRQVQEAYQVLKAEAAGSGKAHVAGGTWTSGSWEESAVKLSGATGAAGVSEEGWDFDHVIEKAGAKEREELVYAQNLTDTIRNWNLLVKPKEFRDFLRDKDREAGRHPVFLESIRQKLMEPVVKELKDHGADGSGKIRVNWSWAVLDELIRFCGFRKSEKEMLTEQERALYDLLDLMRGIDARKREYIKAAATCIVTVILTLLSAALMTGTVPTVVYSLVLMGIYLAVYSAIYLSLGRRSGHAAGVVLGHLMGTIAFTAVAILTEDMAKGIGITGYQYNIVMSSTMFAIGIWFVWYPVWHLVEKRRRG